MKLKELKQTLRKEMTFLEILLIQMYVLTE